MGKKGKYILAVIAVLIAAGAVYYFFVMRPSQEELSESMTRQRSAAEPDQQGAQEPEIEPIEVELDKSDELVRKLVGELSSHPGLARWLVTDNLIRKFVSAVDVMVIGGNPTREMKSIKLTGDFMVGEEEGRVFLDPKSYLRYNRIADIIASLDAEGCVKLYRRLRLPVEQAYRELGYPEKDFDETLKEAMLELLETPVVEDRIYLEKAVITYTMVDPELENLSPAQKNLLRTGPDNMRKIQAKLTEIAEVLGIL